MERQISPFGDENMREAPRFALMLRSAKLVGESGEFLCVIRDVSASGVRLRLFHPLPIGERRLALELANGAHYFIETVWEKDGEAGFRFAAPISVDSFITESSPFPKRPVRLHLRCAARIGVGSASSAAVVHDLSPQGIGVELADRLSLRQLVRIELAGLPALYAKVRWRRHPAYGLVFQQSFRLDELAQLALKMQQSASIAPDESEHCGAPLPLRYA